MKPLLPLILLLSLSAAGQTDRAADCRDIYQLVIRELVDKEAPLINELFAGVTRYDIDGDYDSWLSDKFPKGMIICVVPIRYESTVVAFLKARGIELDTASVYRQMDSFKPDSLSNYVRTAGLIPCTRAPLHHLAMGNLFKKRKATGLSTLLFDPQSGTAFLKLQVFAKKKQSRYKPSRIVVLQKRGGEWAIAGVLEEKGLPR